MSGELDRAPVEAGPELALQRARSMAERFNELQRWEDAEREACRGLQSDPTDASLHFQLARSQLGREQLEAAERTCRQGLAAQPQSLKLMAYLGAIQMQRGRMSESERTLLAALALDPLHVASLLVYGQLMHVAGHFDKSEALYRRALAVNPDIAITHGKLARLHGERGERREAETSARSAARLDPDASRSHADLGWVRLRAGHPFQARSHFREALRLDPSDSDIEKAWYQADRCCRVVYLPFYWWSLLVARLPGRQFAVWGVVLVLGYGAKALGAPLGVVTALFIAYLGLCVYTWFAPALLKGWLRLVPPRIDR